MDKMIQNRIIELFASVNFTCQNCGRQELSFLSADGSVEIIYNIHQYPMYSFFTSKGGVKELRIYINIKFGEECITIRPSQFKSYSSDIDCLTSDSSAKLEENMLHATDVLITTFLPLLNDICSKMIRMSSQYYLLLSTETIKQAKDFANQHHRDLSYTPENKLWAANWLLQKRQTALENNSCSDVSLKELIAFAAYIGEMLLSKHTDGSWEWVCFPDDKIRKFGIVIPSLEDGYDPMQMVIRFWNFSPYFSDIYLFPQRHK